MRKNIMVYFIIGIVSLLIILIGNQYILQVATMCMIYCLLTMSLNLITGFTGQLSLGQSAFYAIGAYCSALLSIKLGIPIILSMILAGFIAALFGFLVGFPSLRLKGIYLGIATLGFAEVVRQVALIWIKVTRGPMGIPGIPQINIFGFKFSSGEPYFIFSLILVFIIYQMLDKLTKSRTGLAFLAIRDDETAAQSIGIKTAKYRILAFILASFIAGIAGSFFAHFISYISPSSFTSSESFLILSMYALGGPSSLVGSLAGATLLTVASELFRAIPTYREILYSILLISVILFKPKGLSGLLGIDKNLAGLPKENAKQQ